MHSSVVTALLLSVLPCVALAGQPADSRRAELTRMLYDDCGSCHGLTLKGGLGSPLLPQMMQSLSSESIVATILDGRPGTPMPPWRGMLSEEDAGFLARLLKGEPDDR